MTEGYEEDLDMYEEALLLSPNSLRAALGSARAHALQEEFEDAVADATRGLRAAEGHVNRPAPGEAAGPIELEELRDLERARLVGLLLLVRARAQLERDELGKAIADAVDALPLKHRTAFVLREYEGLSYEEMAQVMHCSQGTVMSRLHHARKKLQNSLQRMGVHGGQVK